MGENNIQASQLRYFNDLFIFCDEDKINKVSVPKATELFRSASLSNEVVQEIILLAEVPGTATHLTRKHFYTCLKLIAAHQAGISLQALREEIPPSLVLPLPKFSWHESPPANASSTASAKPNDERRFCEWREVKSPDLIELVRESNSELLLNSDQPSTDSEVESNDTITSHEQRRHRKGGATSPGTWSTASDSPTPTNSVAERPWATKSALWHGMLCEEQRQLLGTEEESSDKHSSDEDEVDLESAYQITPEQREYYIKQFRAVQPDLNGLLSGHIARVFFEKSRIPVEELRHIWQLCDVTRDGALSLAEFTAAMHLVVMRRNNIPIPNVLPPCLMPNLLQTVINGSLSGHPATAEADLLHLESDDNQGVKANITAKYSGDYKRPSQPETNLSLNLNKSTNAATTTASKPKSANHKIVHQFSNDITAIASPPTIPAKSGSNKMVSTTSGSSYGVSNRSGSSSPHNVSVVDGAGALGPAVTPPGQIMGGAKNANKDWNANNKEWTKFTESPTSNVSSPGPKPVNFDLQRTAQAVVSDPQILHPVPLRVTPVAGSEVSNIDDDPNRLYRKADNLVYVAAASTDGVQLRELTDTTSPKQQPQYYNIQQRDSLPNDLRPIQRPQPKKPPSKGILPPPPQRESVAAAAATTEVLSNTSDMTGSLSLVSGRKEVVPPLPPPRPHRHTRSSSLDLNKLKLGNASAGSTTKNSPKSNYVGGTLEPPGASPPQQPYSIDYYMDGIQNTAFADFTKFPDISQNSNHQLHQHYLDHPDIGSGGDNSLLARSTNLTHNRTSAFEIYRKPSSSQSRNSQKSTSPQQPQLGNSNEHMATNNRRKSIEDNVNYDKRLNSISDNLRQARFFKTEPHNLPDVLKYLKEQNLLLLSLCNDLSSELLDVQKRKLEIKAKIELNNDGSQHQKSVSNSVYNSQQPNHHHHHQQQQQQHHHQTNV